MKEREGEEETKFDKDTVENDEERERELQWREKFERCTSRRGAEGEKTESVLKRQAKTHTEEVIEKRNEEG